MAKKASRYDQIIEYIFKAGYKKGNTEVPFERADIDKAADKLKLDRILNLGDLIYTYRYRKALPAAVAATAPKDHEWIIEGTGSAKYKFELTDMPWVIPQKGLTVVKVPNATPGIIDMYALNDEQALLAKVRYSRLIDVFTGLTTYSLQSHMRTQIEDLGQAETDEIYVGMDRGGAHYVIPVQAKGPSDKVGIVQIRQDFSIVESKFPDLIPLPIAAQSTSDDKIALFAFEKLGGKVSIKMEKHYSLVPPEDLSEEELASYKANASLET